MKNTLADLNNILFETLERLLDDDLDEKELQKEIQRSRAVQSVAQTVVNNAQLALDVAKQMYEQGGEPEMPVMLGGGQDQRKIGNQPA